LKNSRKFVVSIESIKAYTLNKLLKMKKGLLVLFVALFMSLSFLTAQDSLMMAKKNPALNALSFRGMVMDYQTFNDGDFGDFTAYHPGFEIGYHRYFTNNISLNVPFKLGVVQSHNRVLEVNDAFHKTVLGLDAKVNYDFLPYGSRFQPYALLGIGGVAEDLGDFNAQIPVGLGVKVYFHPRAALNWQSEYRKSLSDDRDNFHHGLGFIYHLGKGGMDEQMIDKKDMMPADADGDGINDDVDLCPQAAGPAELSGCPDSDGDGIADYEDRCPQSAGPEESGGCPDSDGDGVSDNDDECPNMAGSINNNGCPSENDNDGDGIRNAIDECPDQPGPVSNRGCPTGVDPTGPITTPPDATTQGTYANDGCPEVSDSDGDGILDEDDNCPNQPGLPVYSGCPDTDNDGIDDSRDNCPNLAGPVSNNGCPQSNVVTTPTPTTTVPSTTVPSTTVPSSTIPTAPDGYITIEEANILEIAMRAVQFESARSVITRESFQYLASIADLMARYPSYNLRISGHTDNTGSAARNLQLSNNRARACYEYLVSRGLDASRMSYEGFGESKPIADNGSARGRELNRRVEFVMERN